MHQPNQRTAIAALDAARPVIARLDSSGHPDEIAADLIEAWAAIETSLRALLGGSALSGQPLVGEVRHRGLLDYRHAHSLLNFLAARDRAGRTDYRPTSEDVDAARSGFQALEAALGIGIAANTGMFRAVADPTAVPTDAMTGMPADPSTRPAPGAAIGRRADAAPGIGDPVPVDTTGARRSRGVSSALVVFGSLIALLLVAGAWYFWSETRNPRALQAGIEAFSQGRREVARRQFEEAADAQPKLALPHVYLARMAREDGDMTRAYREITAAITLEPENAIAQREMGQYLLQANQPQLARNFFERAIRIDPNDRAAQGWMGCALTRMGNAEVAERFFQRAGPGNWTQCRQAAAPFGAPPGGGLVQPPAAGAVDRRAAPGAPRP